MNNLSRRTFLAISATTAAAAAASTVQTIGESTSRHAVKASDRLLDRIEGLIIGSAIGDALGGPIEFQSRDKVQSLSNPPKVWIEGEKLDSTAKQQAANRLFLRTYADLRPGTESYGQWNKLSPPGTITDDTRHKLVLFHALHQADRRRSWPISARDLALAFLEWPKTRAVKGRPGYEELASDWLEEWQLGARWVLGSRDPQIALPPERMWQSLPTCCGQMTLPPLAAIFAGRPVDAYRAAYSLGFFDNGFGKDLNAALIAALSQALVTEVSPADARAPFGEILRVMRETDPLRFQKIRWTTRAVTRWLDLALKFSRDSGKEPARLFKLLETEFQNTTKWEAQVPFVVAFACLDIADYHPLAALQLSLEWGHDTDSYAQVVGALIGAAYGRSIFPASWQDQVVQRLIADHGVDLREESRFLARLNTLGLKRKLVSGL